MNGWLFVTLSFLNAFDAIATDYGLRNELVEERNPIALKLWEVHPWLFLGVKLFLSIIFLVLPLAVSKETWNKKWWTYLLITVNIIYVTNSIVHIYGKVYI